MKKILFLFLIISVLVGAEELKKIPNNTEKIKENQWIEVKFNFFKRTKYFIVELDEKYEYKVIVSDVTSNIYGAPKAKINLDIYNEQFKMINDKEVENNKTIYVVLKAQKNKGNAYIYVEKRTKGQNKEGIYEKIKDPNLPEIKDLPLKPKYNTGS